MNKDIQFTLGAIGFVLVAAVVLLLTGNNPMENFKVSNDESPIEQIENIVVEDKYVDYTTNYLAQYSGKTKILFFHANWCPTCKAAQEDILANIDQIPEDVVIIKTDYDTQTELKNKYGITYQHTYVITDDQGNELKKWNGGGVEEIINNLNN